MNKSGKGMVMLKTWNYGKRLSLLKMYIIDNSNISSEHLNSSRLHVNSLSLPQCSVFVCLCNDDCKGKSDTAGPKHFFWNKSWKKLNWFRESKKCRQWNENQEH